MVSSMIHFIVIHILVAVYYCSVCYLYKLCACLLYIYLL